MTALFGVAGSWPRQFLHRQCVDGIARQSFYWTGDPHFVASVGACLALALHAHLDDLPSDRALLDDGRYVLAADARLDNRDDLLAAIGDPALGQRASDSELILSAWQRWGTGALARFVGSFAIAVWDSAARRLILARSATFDRPLCYRVEAQGLRFASMPSGLFEESFKPALEALSRLIVHRDHRPEETCFTGIRQVLPGHFLEWSPESLRETRFWTPPAVDFDYRGDALEEFRHLLDLAVEARLKRPSGRVASHLSAGLDSGAVTAIAAQRIADRNDLIAYTGVPAPGLDLVFPPRLIADESSIAASVARRYSLTHRCESRGSPLLDDLRDYALAYQAPLPNLPNYGWGTAIEEDAAARGATVLLSATRGNATISYGNVDILSEWLRHGWLFDYARQIRLLAKKGTASWQGALFYSMDEVVPSLVWNRIAGVTPDRPDRLFIRREWFDRAGAPRSLRDGCAPGVRAIQYEIFANGDMGMFNKGVLATSGLDERDPGGDLRLAEFCLRLPPQHYLRDGIARRLARVGLAQLLPEEVIGQRARGYQGADWFARFDLIAAREMIADLSNCVEAEAILDFKAMIADLDRLPAIAAASPAKLRDWGQRFTRALAVGSFLSECSRQFDEIGRAGRSSALDSRMVEQR